MAPARGEDIHQVLDLSFEEALRGAVRECHYRREGRVPGVPRPALGAGDADRDLPLLPGARRGRGSARAVDGAQALPDLRRGGESGKEPCRVCRGRGHVPVAEKRAVRVAAGSSSGSRIVVPGAGQPGRRGGEPGDLVVTLKVQPHPLLERRGQNLYVSIPVTLRPGGARRPGRGADGRGPHDAAAPPGHAGRPGLHPARQGRALARGGARGDLHVTVTVTLPSGDDPRVRRAMQELEKALAAPARVTP